MSKGHYFHVTLCMLHLHLCIRIQRIVTLFVYMLWLIFCIKHLVLTMSSETDWLHQTDYICFFSNVMYNKQYFFVNALFYFILHVNSFVTNTKYKTCNEHIKSHCDQVCILKKMFSKILKENGNFNIMRFFFLTLVVIS